jgi:hypothetical protein
MKKIQKNNIYPYVEYAKNIGIEDYYIILEIIQNATENYFKKTIYFDNNYELRFLDTSKKISISNEFAKFLLRHLKKEIINYKNSNTIKRFKIQSSIINITIIKYDQKNKKFLGVYKEIDERCYVDAYDQSSFSIGERVDVFCYKVTKDAFYTKVNKRCATHNLNKLFNKSFFISVEKYIKGKVLVFKYSRNEKLSKEEIQNIKTLLPVSKLVYIQKNEE